MASVTIAQGKLRGSEAVSENGHKFYEFLSIPYAKPPVGDLRFKSPQPAETWEGERDATKSVIENIALQSDFVTGNVTGSENCLYLNVYTPCLPPHGSKLLPVMVNIHGGGFIIGNGTIKAESGPDFLLENDVVIVSINYRLGVFGFLSLDIPEVSGNMGLKDQVKALEWVQMNIDKFGGDRNNVTIFGVSAGSASVEYLMLSPTTRGLFHKAILQSGSALNDWAISFQYEQLALNLADKLEYKGDKNGKRALYEFFLTVPAAKLTSAAYYVVTNFPAKSIFFGFVPIVEKVLDGAFLTSHPYKILKEGNFAKIPVVRGFCNVEGAMTIKTKPASSKELIAQKSFTNFWSYKLSGVYDILLRNVYFNGAKSDEDFNKRVMYFFGDLHFSAGVWIASTFFAKHKTPEYVYKFSYDGNLNYIKKTFDIKNIKGASHGDDLGYVFKMAGNKTEPNNADIIFRSKMTKMWTNFAKTGNPTPKMSMDIEWPIFTEHSKMVFNLDNEITIENDYEPERMAVFEEIYKKYEK